MRTSKPRALPLTLLLPFLSSACGSDSASSETDASINPDASVSPDAEPTPSSTFSNVPPDCLRDQVVAPILPEGAGNLTATMLTPPTTPFVVESITYELGHNGDPCVADLAHRVIVYVDNDGTPNIAPSETNSFQSYDMPASDQAITGDVDVTLSSPLTLEDGDRLVIGVTLTATDTTSLCWLSCSGNAQTGVDYSSTTREEPYEWSDLVADFGTTSNIAASATGKAEQR